MSKKKDFSFYYSIALLSLLALIIFMQPQAGETIPDLDEVTSVEGVIVNGEAVQEIEIQEELVEIVKFEGTLQETTCNIDAGWPAHCPIKKGSREFRTCWIESTSGSSDLFANIGCGAMTIHAEFKQMASMATSREARLVLLPGPNITARYLLSLDMRINGLPTTEADDQGLVINVEEVQNHRKIVISVSEGKICVRESAEECVESSEVIEATQPGRNKWEIVGEDSDLRIYVDNSLIAEFSELTLLSYQQSGNLLSIYARLNPDDMSGSVLDVEIREAEFYNII
ncbi:MAG: hypothetical protein QGI80_00650 [archaeon]|jgi:hypothetical protein|nr:hypothetical protein [Euryarchaeota archaeon]MDP7260458.1 hypothetical protein [archaeon]|tara:strand:+ start:48487 stop:49341 length:855 start_codon:yes stop_codon:yes gene_type:complete